MSSAISRVPLSREGTPACLERARTLLRPALEEASATLAPDVRRIVHYHWGWVDAEGNRRHSPPGKAVRPALALLSAEAVCGSAAQALSGAAAVELTHDFTLLHDDVMDEDRERRHRPTAWTVFGVGPAICAGDALAVLAQQVLLRDPSPDRAVALAALQRATQHVIAGQTLDLRFEGDLAITPADTLEMMAGKTGALLGCAASIGAILAGASEKQVADLREFGEALGIAFQAADDWLGIWGRSDRTGKPVANDLRRRKASLPVTLALSAGTDASAALRGFYEREGGRDGEDEIERAVAWIESTGAERRVREIAEEQLQTARAALLRVGPPAATHDELLSLAAFVVDRQG
ncbi:MAG: polyprenyl synthetase family protein [Myxococcota bacterium]|nr:polyprenyl synthetase family protein [Myxococcota bacterium]